MSVRPWFLGSAPAAPAKYPTRIQLPRWRDVARAAAMERERGDRETSAVGWGRAPRTRNGGLSVRSWSLGSAPAAPAKCHIPNEDPPRPVLLAGCRTRSGGGVRARRHGGAYREMGPRAAHAGRGLVCPLLVLWAPDSGSTPRVTALRTSQPSLADIDSSPMGNAVRPPGVAPDDDGTDLSPTGAAPPSTEFITSFLLHVRQQAADSAVARSNSRCCSSCWRLPAPTPGQLCCG